jgi:hypothetical protein
MENGFHVSRRDSFQEEDLLNLRVRLIKGYIHPKPASVHIKCVPIMILVKPTPEQNMSTTVNHEGVIIVNVNAQSLH